MCKDKPDYKCEGCDNYYKDRDPNDKLYPWCTCFTRLYDGIYEDEVNED